jgi:hypothetical protein
MNQLQVEYGWYMSELWVDWKWISHDKKIYKNELKMNYNSFKNELWFNYKWTN